MEQPLLHHSAVVTIRGESYRLLEKRRSGLIRRTGQVMGRLEGQDEISTIAKQHNPIWRI